MAMFDVRHHKKNSKYSIPSSDDCMRCGQSITRMRQFLSRFSVARHTCYFCGSDICNACSQRDMTQTNPEYSQYFCSFHLSPNAPPMPVLPPNAPRTSVLPPSVPRMHVVPGYRSDFYRIENFIGTTKGNPNWEDWTYYFLSATEWGHITTIHQMVGNIGRMSVMPRAGMYFIDNAYGRLVENYMGMPVHRSRSGLVLEATSSHVQEIQRWGGNWPVEHHDLTQVTTILQRFPHLKVLP